MQKDFINILLDRRSHRKFLPDPVPKEDIEKIIYIATMSPSATNSQPWEYIAVYDNSLKEELANAVLKKLEFLASTLDKEKDTRQIKLISKSSFYFTFFKEAPVVIFAIAKPYKSVMDFINEYFVEEDEPSFAYEASIQSVSASILQLQIAAHILGYGSCWMTAPNIARKEMGKILGIQEADRIVATIPLGKPAIKDLAAPRRKSVNEVLRFM
ncbi:Nitroreductase [Thermodesulfobium acidiphilum]|uniref:Nitroreductase n=1 Tax=Thermodesulfobium acidiphilum TaxID=1794699 RepID=A0A2R4W2N1_THEAF|nr:nitroreductase family protein [Thermodesulfobium acidiphilum]AWB11079.1 Nitroreductase [Thermodesulfobium acidiphilum]